VSVLDFYCSHFSLQIYFYLFFIHPIFLWLCDMHCSTCLEIPPSTELQPISLTATLSKLLELFIDAWIPDRIKDKLDIHQYGALKVHLVTQFFPPRLGPCPWYSVVWLRWSRVDDWTDLE